MTIYIDALPPGAPPLCVEFSALRDAQVGNLQPAVSTLEDYYQPEAPGRRVAMQAVAQADGSAGEVSVPREGETEKTKVPMWQLGAAGGSRHLGASVELLAMGTMVCCIMLRVATSAL